MNTSIESRLNILAAAGRETLLKGGLKGLEKESLRVTPRGRIAQTPHPSDLGSALKHPFITTDYSEALIELITPPFEDPAETLGFLDDLHRFVYQHIGDELLWAASMPCEIEGDASIPIAEFGKSNIGRMKHVYRRGLAWRYGRAMQSIAGIHFNYSVNEALWPEFRELLGSGDNLGDFIASQYFGLIRNVLRHGWLILYLYGSSPALCGSFFAGRYDQATGFMAINGTLFRPYATSLRMSDIGYRNDSQSGLDISFDSLEDYVASLAKAIHTPYPAYERIGVKVDGEYRQLNANILQIPNEYYSLIRPKQVAQSCEHPTFALKRRGVRYIELRSLDLGLSHPLGLTLDQMRFLELFLLCCLLRPSHPLSEKEKGEIGTNVLRVACCGRTPGLMLQRNGETVSLLQWTKELADDLGILADVLDGGERGQVYRDSLKALEAALDDPESTPSALILSELRKSSESFQSYTLRYSKRHADQFRTRPLDAQRYAEFAHEAEESRSAQASIEANDTLAFDEFLERYFAQSD